MYDDYYNDDYCHYRTPAVVLYAELLLFYYYYSYCLLNVSVRA
jgi:hypothetical protein